MNEFCSCEILHLQHDVKPFLLSLIDMEKPIAKILVQSAFYMFLLSTAMRAMTVFN